MDGWAAAHGVTAPHLAQMKRSLLAGLSASRLRVFLMRRAGGIDAVITLLPAPLLDGWLLDQEYYRPGVAAGCLEFGIVGILEKVRAEGSATLSLGLTLGTQIEAEPGDDDDLRRSLAGLHQAGILDGDANFQFKSKFRPRTRACWLCCSPEAGARHLGDLLALLANPLHRGELEALAEPAAAGEATASRPAQRRTRSAGGSREPDGSREVDGSREAEEIHPLLGRRLSLALRSYVFASAIGCERQPFLADHRLRGLALLPAAALIGMAAAAAAEVAGGDAALANLTIQEPLPLPPGVLLEVQTAVTPVDEASFRCEIFSRPAAAPAAAAPAAGWQLVACAEIRRCGRSAPAAAELAPLVERGTRLDAAGFYRDLAAAGYEYGPAFRTVRQLLRIGDLEILARVELPAGTDAGGYDFHPALLDGCIQAGLPLLGAGETGGGLLWLPIACERFRRHGRSRGRRPPSGGLWAHLRRVSAAGAAMPSLAITLFDDGGALLAEVEGLLCKRADDAVLARLLAPAARPELADALFELTWRPRPRQATAAPAAADAAAGGGAKGANRSARLRTPGAG